VAVKVVHPHLADDEQAAARFLNEARAASRLSHPNSVAIYDFGRTEDKHPYIVMEYLRGRDLRRVADAEGPLPIRRVVDALRQTLAALEEAHALGIVHRDLKPDNVVLEPLRSGLDFVKVVDFGLAKFLAGDVPTAPNGKGLTFPGVVCGTPEYMSPEQARGDPLDGRSDLYAVGVVLFELLAGRVPFADDSPTRTLLLHLSEPPPDPRDVAPDRAIPAPFAALALRALAKSREDRFQSARSFADELGRALLDSEGRHSVAPAPVSAVHCRACGAVSPLRQKFCGECGASIAGNSPPREGRGPTSRDDTQGPTLGGTEAVGAGSFPLPLLGRDQAIAWLEGRRHEAGAMFTAAHVLGEAGMGKTRIVREMLARWAGHGDVVVAVAPDATWAKVAHSAVKSAVRALAALAEGPFDLRGCSGANALAQKGLRLLFHDDDETSLNPGERRDAVAEALRWALERAGEMAGSSLVVLAIDDLDFIDGASRNAVVDVLSDPPVVSALAVVTYAPGTFHAGDPLPGEVCILPPLPYEAFAHLLPRHLAIPDVALAPLHVDQLTAWARESNEPPPERLADLISRRAERLAPDARHVVQALAVWGDDATADILGKLVHPTVDLAGALDALARARLVAFEECGIRISHPLARRVIFSSIPAQVKRDLFGRAAALRPDAPLEVRAKQAMHGGSALEALALLDTLSSRRAIYGDLPGSVSALRHALDVARRELHRGEIDDPVGAVLIFARKLAEALAASQHLSDAEGVLREALGSAPPASGHRAHLLGVLARVADARHQPSEARRYLDEAMRVARQSDARSLLPLLERLDRTIAVA
jgi:serine/threonine-protein kinase